MENKRRIYFRYKQREPGQQPQLYFPGFNHDLILRGSLDNLLDFNPQYYSIKLPESMAKNINNINQVDLAEHLIEKRDNLNEEEELTTLFELDNRYDESQLLHNGIEEDEVSLSGDGSVTISSENTDQDEKHWIEKRSDGYNFGILLSGLIFETRDGAVKNLQYILTPNKTVKSYNDLFSTVRFLLEKSDQVKTEEFFQTIDDEKVINHLSDKEQLQWYKENVLKNTPQRDTVDVKMKDKI